MSSGKRLTRCVPLQNKTHQPLTHKRQHTLTLANRRKQNSLTQTLTRISSLLLQDWQDERRKEFRRVIDLNADGKVSNAELKLYVDPKNPNHARAEARNLIELVDSDKDGALSLDEVIAGKEIILGSKMVHTGQSLHDEF